MTPDMWLALVLFGTGIGLFVIWIIYGGPGELFPKSDGVVTVDRPSEPRPDVVAPAESGRSVYGVPAPDGEPDIPRRPPNTAVDDDLDPRFTEPPAITTSEPKGPRIRYVDVDSYEDALKHIETGERSTAQEGLLKPCPECGGDLYPFTVYEHLFSRRLGKDGRPACSYTERRAGG